MRISKQKFTSSFSKRSDKLSAGIKIQPLYEVEKEEEKKFQSPLEKPKKREKNNKNQIIFYK